MLFQRPGVVAAQLCLEGPPFRWSHRPGRHARRGKQPATSVTGVPSGPRAE